jgi:aspartyl-tRNA(Asn)/glutamyl-tRNA(Gln) amidotransferase subunit A
MTRLLGTGDELLDASACALSALIRDKKVSPVELVERALARIEALQPSLNAFITVTADEARRAAREAEREIMAGRWRGPLHGLPFAAKDMILTKGVRTTMGSRLHADAVPASDAVPVARLKEQGAILLGKTTTPEFGHKPLTDGPLFGCTLNPYDAGVTCGGSSGGSAVALASRQVPLALGTDGGGSIRIPAACCGVVGFKATLGVVPHLDLPDLFSANAFIGPMARSVADARLLFDAIKGFDARDPYGQAEQPRSAPLAQTKGLRIGWMAAVGNREIDPECLAAAEAGVRRLAEAGAIVEPIEPDFVSLEDAFLVILQSALRSRLIDRLERDRDRIDPSLVRMIEDGARWSAVDLQRAGRTRSTCFAAVQSLLERFDVLASPTLAAPPLPVTQDPHGRALINGRDAGRIRGAWYPYTYPFNLTGHPALTVPCGFTRRGLPLGLHLVGRWYAEDVLLHLGIELTADESGLCSMAVMAGLGSGRSVRELPMRRC